MQFSMGDRTDRRGISTRVLAPPGGGATSWSIGGQFAHAPSAQSTLQDRSRSGGGQHYTQVGASQEAGYRQQREFMERQSAGRSLNDARKRGTSTGGGGSTFNPFGHDGQGAYEDPYTNRRGAPSSGESISRTSVASAEDMSFLNNPVSRPVPSSHNPSYGVVASRGGASGAAGGGNTARRRGGSKGRLR